MNGWNEKCPKCGKKRIGGYQYCPKCGHKYPPIERKSRETATYTKCKDCRFLSDERTTVGRKCLAPGKHWLYPSSMYKQPTQRACKKCFEPKETE